MTQNTIDAKIKAKKALTERMLILWQDQVAAEAHAVEAASEEAASAADQEEEAASVAALSVVHTAAASEAHITEVHSADIMADISVDITITGRTITDRIFTARSDRGDALISAALAADVSVSLLLFCLLF